MVEIIKQGQLPGDKIKRCTCRTCSTEFVFKVSEAKYNSDQRDGDFLSIPCPLCRNACITAA